MATAAVTVSGVSRILAGAPAVTVRLAVALVRPVADAVMVAVPVAVGVTAAVATPFTAAADVGLNVPATPAMANETVFVAVVTVLPLAS